MLNRIIHKLRRIRIRPRSRAYVVLVATISVLPIALVIMAWVYPWAAGSRDPWYIRMQDQLLKIIDHIMAPAIVAGVIAYGAKFVDLDGNGECDDYENQKEIKEKNEESNTQRHPDNG